MSSFHRHDIYTPGPPFSPYPEKNQAEKIRRSLCRESARVSDRRAMALAGRPAAASCTNAFVAVRVQQKFIGRIPRIPVRPAKQNSTVMPILVFWYSVRLSGKGETRAASPQRLHRPSSSTLEALSDGLHACPARSTWTCLHRRALTLDEAWQNALLRVTTVVKHAFTSCYSESRLWACW